MWDLGDRKRSLFDTLRRDIGDSRVIDAMERVPREAFVSEGSLQMAYEDVPLPIGEGQTISQPFIVAVMVGALELRRTDRVMEVGTGSGYQAAVLAQLAGEVVSVERLGTLAHAARDRLRELGHTSVTVCDALPELGWPGLAPYDAIVVAACAPRLPNGLIRQLVVGGRLVVPVGSLETQQVLKIVRGESDFTVRTLGDCRFVPLIGEDAWPDGDRAGQE